LAVSAEFSSAGECLTYSISNLYSPVCIGIIATIMSTKSLVLATNTAKLGSRLQSNTETPTIAGRSKLYLSHGQSIG
jgi:hypothetical protein